MYEKQVLLAITSDGTTVRSTINNNYLLHAGMIEEDPTID